MAREILFRAKRKDNGEWVKGFYVKTFASLLRDIILPVEVDADENQDTQRIEFDIYYEVIPETVGQYTGMKDNNGKPIFEGDILKLGIGKTRFVFYGVSSFRHTIYNGYAKEFDFKDKGYQVIGNIHDNPELLKD
jgi:hypothetical protein